MKRKHAVWFVVASLIAAALVTLIAAKHRRAAIVSRTHNCDNQMCQIDGAKEQFAHVAGLADGESVTPEQISPYIYRGWTNLRCRSGGTYIIHTIGEMPECSVHGTPRSGLIYR